VTARTPSDGVLDLAGELGRRFGATIVALHVREWPFVGSEWVLGEGAFVEGRAEALGLLDRVVGQLRSAGATARGIVRGGRPSEIGTAIVDAARSEHADLIILGFHRHSLLTELLGGSVARQVRRRADVPVLTVPSPA
jgi:nucleotide-binding universal stress UspA family protein